MMDAKARIQQLMDERQWTEYRLAIVSGLSQSTVANIFNRNTTPSVATLQSICAGFGITLAQFFAEGELIALTPEQQDMFAAWASLTAPQKDALRQLIEVMKK
ncbi:MAG: helix-turn-helix transcriptional regulator [Clostridia bacterium]